MRRDSIRQVIVPDSKGVHTLFYAALGMMLTATVVPARFLEKFTAQYISELLEMPNSLGLAPLHVVLEMGHVATVKVFAARGRASHHGHRQLHRSQGCTRWRSPTWGRGRCADSPTRCSRIPASTRYSTSRTRTASALSLAVNKGHTYLALRLLEKGASLTPDAGEALGLDNALTVANAMHSLVLARNVAAIRWLIVRSDSDPKVVLSRDGRVGRPGTWSGWATRLGTESTPCFSPRRTRRWV